MSVSSFSYRTLNVLYTYGTDGLTNDVCVERACDLRVSRVCLSKPGLLSTDVLYVQSSLERSGTP